MYNWIPFLIKEKKVDFGDKIRYGLKFYFNQSPVRWNLSQYSATTCGYWEKVGVEGSKLPKI